MKSKNHRITKILLIIIFVLALYSIFYIPLPSENKINYSDIKKQEDFSISTNQLSKKAFNNQWIENSDFSNNSGWITEVNGDARDVDAYINGGSGNLITIGEEHSITLISGTPNSTNSPSWYNNTNPEIPVYPTNGHKINESGCFASHYWAEHSGTTTNAYQKTSVQWEKVISTPHNMSDYFITSASLKVLINATAKAYVGCGDGDVWHWEGVEASGDSDMTRFIEGDYIKFYVRLSTLNKDVNYKVSEYQPTTLGQDGAQILNSYDYLNDTIFQVDDMDDLIFYLNQVLENGDFQNFIIILGIEYNCEDNCATDLDEFTEAYIKSCNFTINYIKKIDQLTSISWKYLGNQIDSEGGIVEITDAKLYFDYKIDKLWLTNLSPNSEIKFVINEQDHLETIKLSLAELDFKNAKEEGFEVTNLIPSNDNINISIQLLLADEFKLSENYTISIDNVILWISYNIYFQTQSDFLFQFLLIGAIIASGLLGGYYIYYRKVLRFPKAVRHIKKYRRTLNKPHPPDIHIVKRENAFKKKYKKELSRTSSFIGTPRPKAVGKKISVKKQKSPLKKKNLIFLIFILLGITFIPIIITVNMSASIRENKVFDINLAQQDSTSLWTRESHREQWIKNYEFNTNENWTSSLKGDVSDIEPIISNGTANYKILGGAGSQQFFENGNSSGWVQVDNDDGLPLMDSYEINADGWFTAHTWDDNEAQSLRVPWRKNFTMNVNMSDYYITSASLEAWINGSAQAVSMDNGGIDRPGDTLVSNPLNELQIATGDFARFFILISDVERNREFESTSYQTDDLGKDGPTQITELNNTLITPVNEETLIFYLEQALQYDHQNFAITLGVYIWCEDSGHPGDRDYWNSLLIKNFTLSISYEKRINQFTSVSWNYAGEKIEAGGRRVKVTNAELYFDFKIDQTWPTSLSPNSEFKILINNQVHNETIKLSNAKTSFNTIKEDGFDVTKLVPIDEDINITIQIFLADEFGLSNVIELSIDNTYLWISYVVIIPLEQTLLFQILFILSFIGATILTTYILLYQRILKYPKPVRKVRKYKKTLRKKKIPGFPILNRELAFRGAYRREMIKTSDYYKGKPIIHKGEEMSTKIKPSEPIEKKLEQDQLIKKSLEHKEELDKLIADSDKK